MPSEARQQIQMFMKDFATRLDLKGKDVLNVGTAGDPKEGENRDWFGKDVKSYKTLDKLIMYNPDIVADITDTKLPRESYDVIILSQVIEHIVPFDVQKAVDECYRLLRKGGILILDCPWLGVQYHPEEGFDDYSRFSVVALIRFLVHANFKVAGEECKQSPFVSFTVGVK